MKKYNIWFESRNLDVRDYQIDQLFEIDKHIEKTKVVLAACPGSGKTNMSICFIDNYLKKYPNHRVLILPHGTTVLKSQFMENILKLVPDFTYSTDLKSNPQVLISLPQTLHRKNIGKFDLIVIDEAHQFYNADMVKSIINKTKPKRQLLLTGTPSPFVKLNMIKNEFHISCVDMHILFNLGFMEDVCVENATTTYKYDLDDYNHKNELQGKIKFTQDETNETLDLLIKSILKRLGSILKIESKLYSMKEQTIKLNWGWGSIGKTMIVSRNQEQAKQIKKYFEANDIKYKLSISDTDSDSSQIEEFKNDKSCNMLIVCNRANIGFDYPDLINVVDLSGTANVDRLYQMFSRLIRKRKKKGQDKFFFKVVSNEMSNYFRYIMEGMLHLTHKDFLLKFNGKNFDRLKFPIREKITRNREKKSDAKHKTSPKVDFIPSISIGSIIRMNELYHKHDKLLNGYAFTTMREVQSQLGMKQLQWKNSTKDEIRKELETILSEYHSK